MSVPSKTLVRDVDAVKANAVDSGNVNAVTDANDAANDALANNFEAFFYFKQFSKLNDDSPNGSQNSRPNRLVTRSPQY